MSGENAGRQHEAPKRGPRWKRLRRSAIVLCLLALLGFAGAMIFLNRFGDRDRAQPAQAIVILGARVAAPGVPGATLRRRTLHAVELYKRGLAPFIICTGGVGDHPPAEAQAAANLAMRHGVPSKVLLLEDQSKTTWENARNTAQICRKRGWTRVIVASDAYHLWRACRYFGRFDIIAYASPAPPGQSWPDLWMTAREVLSCLRDVLVRR